MSSTSIDTDTITVLEVSFEGNNGLANHGAPLKNDSEISSSDPGEDEQDFPRNSGNFELNHDITTSNPTPRSRRNSIFTITNTENIGAYVSHATSEIANKVHSVEHGAFELVNHVIHGPSKIRSTLNKSPVYDPFTKSSFFWVTLSMILEIVDIASDIAVAVKLHQEKNTEWWFRLTLILILVPLVLVNLFSIFWHHQDHNRDRNSSTFREGGFCPVKEKHNKKERIFVILFHLFMCGHISRFLKILYCGYFEYKNQEKHNIEGPYCPNPKSRKKENARDEEEDYYTLRKYYERDSAYLGLINAFIQDGPQLILQLYILAVRDHDALSDAYTAVYQVISIFLSLSSLSSSIVAYIQASRWADVTKPQMTPMGYFVSFLWRFFIVFSRVFMLSLFATIFQMELFIFLGLHWLFMTTWIFLMGTNYCGSAENRKRPLAEILYNIVIGFVFIFDCINLKEGATRLKNFLYYFILTCEAGILMSFWYQELSLRIAELNPEDYVVWSHQKWYRLTGVISIPACFILGIVNMLIYYRFYHPDGKMPNKNQSSSIF